MRCASLYAVRDGGSRGLGPELPFSTVNLAHSSWSTTSPGAGWLTANLSEEGTLGTTLLKRSSRGFI